MKKIYKWVALLLTGLLLSGCASEQTQKETKNKSVVALTKAMDSLHWLAEADGMQRAAADYSIDLTILWPETEDDSDVQDQLIQDAITAKPDAIALAPCDASDIRKYITKFQENDIELFYTEEDPENEDNFYVGSDNYFSGKLAAQALTDVLPEKAKVAVIGGNQKQTAHYKRAHGFQDYIEQETGLSFVELIEVPDSTFSGGQEAMQKLLEETPDIQGVFCASAMMVMGALRECQLQGRDDIKLVGMDTQSDVLTAVKNGSIVAMVSQSGYDIGYTTIETIAKKLNGEQISKVTYVTNKLIKQDNVDDFLQD